MAYPLQQVRKSAGKPFSLLVRAEDEFFNLQRDFDGIVYVRDEHEELIGEIPIVKELVAGKSSLIQSERTDCDCQKETKFSWS